MLNKQMEDSIEIAFNALEANMELSGGDFAVGEGIGDDGSTIALQRAFA